MVFFERVFVFDWSPLMPSGSVSDGIGPQRRKHRRGIAPRGELERGRVDGEGRFPALRGNDAAHARALRQRPDPVGTLEGG